MPKLRRSLTPWRALLLAALLLAAQALGLAHRLAHAPGGHGSAQTTLFWGHAAPHGHAHAAAAQGDHGHHGHGHDHAGSEAGAECRLYDQLLGHADVLVDAAPAAGLSPRAALPALADLAGGSTRAPAAYQARAPPAA